MKKEAIKAADDRERKTMKILDDSKQKLMELTQEAVANISNQQ